MAFIGGDDNKAAEPYEEPFPVVVVLYLPFCEGADRVTRILLSSEWFGPQDFEDLYSMLGR